MVNDVANAPTAAAAGGASSSGSGDVDLPRAQIKRILQSKLTTGSDGKSLAVSKDAMLAFSESAKVFISYISTTANDIAHESKRQTISAEDVVKAVEELEFAELVAPLKEYMEGAWAAWACSLLGDPFPARYGTPAWRMSQAATGAWWFRGQSHAADSAAV